VHATHRHVTPASTARDERTATLRPSYLSLDRAGVMALQRTVGNAAAGRVLARARALARRPGEAKIRARAYELYERSGGGIRTREQDEATYFEALRQVEIEERAHRIWRQGGGDPVANYYEAERQIAEERRPVSFGESFPAGQQALIEQAWAILRSLAAGEGTAHEIERVAAITRLPGGQLGHLATPMFERISATPNTSLVVEADRGPKRDPSVAGTTTLFAEYDGTKAADMGTIERRESFWGLLKSVPRGRRNQVKFTIKIKLLIPFYEHFHGQAGLSLQYYFETLAHEVALHGEKYVQQIMAWQESDDVTWKPTYEYHEHQEHMFGGNPRYVLLTGRLLERGDLPPGLLPGVEGELKKSRETYTKEQMKPPEGATDRAMLDWLERLKHHRQ
jgi:hypothetical protein